MTGITVFPNIDNVLYWGQNVYPVDASATLDASGSVQAGQVVGFSDTGVGKTLAPSYRAVTNAVSGVPVGVAIEDASQGQPFSVAGPGCICYVANCDDTTAIDAGTWLEVSNNKVGGTVCARLDASENHFLIGIAWDDIAASGTGRMLVQPCMDVQFKEVGS